ncbi:MAG TPA: hypothetical protein VMF58_18400 [Rhizomicrobium sp.]|nr:hypothetical protein [Rhizomicrobium sp.]
MLRTFLSLSIATVAIVAPLSANAHLKGGGEGFIVVGADGTKVRGSASFTATLYRSPGEYQVVSDLPVRDCAYSVTEGSSDSSAPPAGFANTVGIYEDSHVIMVATYDESKQLANRGFHLIVRC